MTALTLRSHVLTSAAEELRRCRVMSQPGRAIPSINRCGSDEVILAYMQTFQAIREQDSALYASLAALGDNLKTTVDEFLRLDAEIAAGPA